MSAIIATIATAAAFGAALYRYLVVLVATRHPLDLELETARGFFGGIFGGILVLLIGEA